MSANCWLSGRAGRERPLLFCPREAMGVRDRFRRTLFRKSVISLCILAICEDDPDDDDEEFAKLTSCNQCIILCC